MSGRDSSHWGGTERQTFYLYNLTHECVGYMLSL